MSFRSSLFATGAVLCAAATAHAETTCSAPLSLVQAGRLLDASDQPVTNPDATMRFRLFRLAAPENDATPLWDSGSCLVSIVNGHYAVVLGDGCGQSLCASHFTGSEKRYLEVSFGTTAELPHLHGADGLHGRQLRQRQRRARVALLERQLRLQHGEVLPPLGAAIA